MRVHINGSSVKLWLSAKDTYYWANRPLNSWPCSELSNKRLFAEFDSNGLLDVAINGWDADIPADEFNAITSDHLRDKLPADHPARFVAVDQFPAA